VPLTTNVQALVRDYRSGETISAGEPFDPSSVNVEARIRRARIAPGLKASLLPKRTRGGEVHAVLTLRFGDPESLTDRQWAGFLTAQMLLRGTVRHTREQIRDELTRAGSRIYLSGAADHITATIVTRRNDLDRVFRLFVEALRYPAFPDHEFVEVKRSLLLSVSSEKNDPDAASWNALTSRLHPYPPGDVRRVQSPDERVRVIGQIGVSDVRAFYEEFYGASDGELAVVGDFDPTELQALVEDSFHEWTSPRKQEPVARDYRPVSAGTVRLVQPGRRNAAFQAGLALPLTQDSADYAALVVGAYAMGGGFLSSRLPLRIRKQDGLSYWIESRLYGGPLDSGLTFVTSAACEPSQLAALRAAFADELARSVQEGFRPDEIEAAKLGWLRARQLAMSNDSQLVWDLASDLFAGRSRSWHGDLQKRISSLTPEQVTAAWRRYIDPSAIIIVEAGDLEFESLDTGAN
jgi:zinc protease